MRTRDGHNGTSSASARHRRVAAWLALLSLLPLAGCEGWWGRPDDPAYTHREVAPHVEPGAPATRIDEPTRVGEAPTPSAPDADERTAPPPQPCADPVPHDAPLLTGVRTNVLGGRLGTCSMHPLTGFHRDGTCRTDERDRGMHVVCAEVTGAFLAHAKAHGSDLMKPDLKTHFPGLRPGNRWCVCAGRWAAAHADGVAPPVVLGATASKALQIIEREALFGAALDAPSEELTERPAKTATR